MDCSTSSVCLILISFFLITNTLLHLKKGVNLTRPKEYVFVTNVKLSWHNAFEYCRTRGMFLVSIHNKAELEAVKEVITSSNYPGDEEGFDGYHDADFIVRKYRNPLHMWTSLNDIGTEGEYRWASTGKKYEYGEWRIGEPNNVKHGNCTDEDCVMLVHYPLYNIRYALDDRPCNVEQYFMCETLEE